MLVDRADSKLEFIVGPRLKGKWYADVAGKKPAVGVNTHSMMNHLFACGAPALAGFQNCDFQAQSDSLWSNTLDYQPSEENRPCCRIDQASSRSHEVGDG